METEYGFGKFLDHRDDEVYYGKGRSLPLYLSALRRMSTVLYLAVEKLTPYSRNLVQGCGKSFGACVKTKNSYGLFSVRRYVL